MRKRLYEYNVYIGNTKEMTERWLLWNSVHIGKCAKGTPTKNDFDLFMWNVLSPWSLMGSKCFGSCLDLSGLSTLWHSTMPTVSCDDPEAGTKSEPVVWSLPLPADVVFHRVTLNVVEVKCERTKLHALKWTWNHTLRCFLGVLMHWCCGISGMFFLGHGQPRQMASSLDATRCHLAAFCESGQSDQRVGHVLKPPLA